MDVKEKIVEEAGHPSIVTDIPTLDPSCSIEFTTDPSVYLDKNSTIYSNTKHANDNRECSYQESSWKIDTNGKLLLASMSRDTVYADILYYAKNDSLAFEAQGVSKPGVFITYTFRKG